MTLRRFKSASVAILISLEFVNEPFLNSVCSKYLMIQRIASTIHLKLSFVLEGLLRVLEHYQFASPFISLGLWIFPAVSAVLITLKLIQLSKKQVVHSSLWGQQVPRIWCMTGHYLIALRKLFIDAKKLLNYWIMDLISY